MMRVIMDLIEYCATKGGTGTQTCPVLKSIAEKAGCGGATLYMIARGHKKPSALLARAIATATGNSVTAHDLRPDVFGEASQSEAA